MRESEPLETRQAEDLLQQHFAAEGSPPPDRIGPYRILKRLGEGGMGVVYLAEQQEPVKRKVALKLIKLGMDSLAVVTRFEQERQALALMDHDGIAKVLDCGTSERGQPFFVMELVRGEPLTDYCDARRLSLPERLQLLQQICAAVQHAHQKGVVHRDLKPGNVLVADEDGRAQAKIIDFGLAKAMGQKLVAATLFTAVGQVVGTPEYMAPEQADPTNPDIDTRVDVYSLGVMLYEVLVGQLPFAGEELRRAGMVEMQRILREVEPPTPSTRLSSVGASSTEVAAVRRLSASALQRALKNDLDWVVMKAIDKDRARRYESPGALASDLQRFLDHKPLVAGPPSAGYRLKKFVRRYRGQVLAGTAVLVALVGGGTVAFVQYLRAEDKAADALQQKGKAEASEKLATQRAEENAMLAQEKGELAAAEATARRGAEERAKELEQVLTFQESQWSEADTESMGVHLRRAVLAGAKEGRRAELEAGLAGVNFTNLALAMLQENFFDRVLTAIGKGFAEQPLVKARLLQSVADVLRGVGLLERATAPQTEALEIRRRFLTDDHPSTLTSINNMGNLLRVQGKLAEAEALYREAMEKSRRILGGDHLSTLTSINNLGSLLQAQGKFAEAAPLIREPLEKHRRILGDGHPSTLASISNMGTLLWAQGNLTEAGVLLREALETRRRVLGDDHHDTLASISNMGSLLQAQGNLTEAGVLLREALETRRRVLGDDHHDTLASISNMGSLLLAQGRLEEAQLLCREELEKSRRILGDDHPDTLTSINNMGNLLQAQGKLGEAGAYYREALEKSRRILGDDHQDTLTSICNMGTLLRSQGKLAEAEPLYREALEKRRRILGDDHYDTLNSIGNMGSLLWAQGKLIEAEPFLREALERCRRTLGDDHQQTLSLINSVGLLFQAQRKFAEAEPLYREALETRRRVLGDLHPNTLNSINSMGYLLHAQGKLTEAEVFYREALEKRRRILGDNHQDTLTSISNMGSLLRAQGNLTEAEVLCREALETRRRILGVDHHDTLTSISNMGSLLHAQGKFAEAEPLYREALETRRRMFGDDHQDTLASIINMGTLLVQTGAHSNAIALLLPAEAAARRAFTRGNADRLASFLATLGKAYAGLAQPQDLASAEAKLREAHAIFSKSRGPTHEGTRTCTQSLVDLYAAWHAAEPGNGHDKKAAEWKAKLESLAPEPGKEASR